MTFTSLRLALLVFLTLGWSIGCGTPKEPNGMHDGSPRVTGEKKTEERLPVEPAASCAAMAVLPEKLSEMSSDELVRVGVRAAQVCQWTEDQLLQWLQSHGIVSQVGER